MIKIRRMTLERRRAIYGVLFILPWLIGFLLLMAVPLVQSLRYSVSKLSLGDNGLVLDFVGLSNFMEAFYVDPWFNRNLTSAVSAMALNVPLIIFFSLFSASLLSQKFRGRMLARAVFFLPVVLASGVIANLDSGNYLGQILGSAATDTDGNFSGLQGLELRPLLVQSGMNPMVASYLVDAVDRIYLIVKSSGVQILVFLAGLQTIPPTLYEAGKIEGATGYEMFWKITFPMVTPLILTNTVYTIVDSFYNNQVTGYMHNIAFGELKFGLSSAMAWIYFAIIALILLVTTRVISKRVFYYD